MILAVMVAAAAVAHAQPEASRLAADTAFRAAADLRWNQALTVTGRVMPAANVAASQDDSLFKISLAPADGKAAPRAAANQELDLAALRNRHLKTTLQYTLGGKSAWISGSFDANQEAYVSILADGQPVRFFNVKGLLSDPEEMQIGSANYRVSLSPNLGDQLASEIVLKNRADRNDRKAVPIRDMLAAVSAAGADVKAGGQTYKCFYSDDIKDGELDPSKQSFTFVLTDANGEFHVFLVPAHLVPSDKMAIFKMHNNARVGLQQVGGKLRIYDNP